MDSDLLQVTWLIAAEKLIMENLSMEPGGGDHWRPSWKLATSEYVCVWVWVWVCGLHCHEVDKINYSL